MNGRRLLIGIILVILVIYLLPNTEHLRGKKGKAASKATSATSDTSATSATGTDLNAPASDGSCTTEGERLSGGTKPKSTGICATIPAGGYLQWLRDFVCSDTAGCKEGEESSGGLCYKKCPPGWKSNGLTMCIRQYQGYDCGPNQIGGADPLTLRVPTRVVGPDGVGEECGPDEERSGLLCYPKCDKGYHAVGPVCWADNVRIPAGEVMHFRG